MKQDRVRSNLWPGLHLSAAIVLMVLLGSSVFSQGVALSDCKVGKRAAGTGFWTWASGSQVKVYIIDGDFKSDQFPSLLKPLENWDAVGKTSGADVRLTYAGTTSRLLDCTNCLTIMRGPVFNKKTRHGSELKAFGLEGTQVIQYAAIHIDLTITGSETLSNAVAHELGHSFGLLDCYNCEEGSTVMNRLKGMDVSNGMDGPTACDVAGVRTAYVQLKARIAGNLKTVEIPEDAGEDPVDDDTPIVVPKALTDH